MRKNVPRLVQFRLLGNAIHIMDELKVDLGVGSRAGVIRLALNFLAWFTEALKSGDEITINRNRGNNEAEIMTVPFWELRALQHSSLQTSSREAPPTDNPENGERIKKEKIALTN